VTRTDPVPAGTPAVRSLDQIDNPAVRAALDAYFAQEAVLGILLCGSRVLGWADADGDYDALILVTPEHFRSIPPEQTLARIFAEGETPRRMVGDFAILTAATLDESLRSPLDIDHWPYVDAVVVADRTGTLEERRRGLAAFPEAGWRERALQRYLTLLIAVHYAIVDDVRGFAADRQMNLFRAGLAGIHLWFTLQKRWAPPLKWWTREVERLSIRPDSRAALEAAVLNPTIDTATHLREHLKTEMRHAGFAEVDDIVSEFARTFLPERRAAVYRDSYL
jgi:hypothetical protein